MTCTKSNSVVPRMQCETNHISDNNTQIVQEPETPTTPGEANVVQGQRIFVAQGPDTCSMDSKILVQGPDTCHTNQEDIVWSPDPDSTNKVEIVQETDRTCPTEPDAAINRACSDRPDDLDRRPKACSGGFEIINPRPDSDRLDSCPTKRRRLDGENVDNRVTFRVSCKVSGKAAKFFTSQVSVYQKILPEICNNKMNPKSFY